MSDVREPRTVILNEVGISIPGLRDVSMTDLDEKDKAKEKKEED